jgi:hypothetical protein
MAIQADTTDNKSRMSSKVTVFQGRQSDVPCNKYVGDEIIMESVHLIQYQWRVMQYQALNPDNQHACNQSGCQVGY